MGSLLSSLVWNGYKELNCTVNSPKPCPFTNRRVAVSSQLAELVGKVKATWERCSLEAQLPRGHTYTQGKNCLQAPQVL